MGTTLYDIRKEFANIATQNRVMGVYFANSNDRILINGDSRIVNGEAKGYRDVTGITGDNCLVSWRPSKYDAWNSYGTRIFVNTNLYNDAITLNGWWFCSVGDAYVAMRTTNEGWTWKEETASGSQGGYFELNDDDSPIIIECAQKKDYTNFTAFQNDILDNTFSFSNGVLNYTSNAGEDFTVYRNNDTEYPKINGTNVSFETEFTYNSKHLKGISTSDPYKVRVTHLNEQMEIDFQNLTESYTTLSTENIDYLKKNKLKVFPNPTYNGLFYLKDNLSIDNTWEVYSLLGVKILEGSGKTINLSGNAKGLYILKAKNKTIKLIYN